MEIKMAFLQILPGMDLTDNLSLFVLTLYLML